MKIGYTRRDELYDGFIEFHNEHPEFWDQFVKFTHEAMDRGFKQFGSKAVFERIRWETAIPEDKGHDTTHLKNAYHAFYARMFIEKFPKHKGFFELRFQPSTLKPANNPVDILW